jgi:ANTAR domain/GAF domain
MVAERLDDVFDERPPTLLVPYQVPAALRRLLEQLTGMVPITGCWAVLLAEPAGQLRFVAADPVARRMQTLEAKLGEGPCLYAARTGERVLLPDLTARDAIARFPEFVPRATAAGVAAVYSFSLRTANQRVGAMSLCSDLPAQLDPVDLDLAQLLANLANLTTATIVGAQRERQIAELAAAIEHHLTDAAVLEQAKGRLSMQLRVDADTAFRYLHRYATRTSVPLREVAARVAGGALRLDPDDAYTQDRRGRM